MLWTRDEIEARERATLAPYALKSGDSKGRVYPEGETLDRSAFQRDRDRILHTTAFRRLEYKTQVFVNHEGDYFRTRLTHTLEVAQIGRTLARILGANEDLVETICLVHDIGHPPFGHSGEMILNQLMADHGGFDHNQQALRIVTELEQRYVEFPGLNLTYETREGIVKHETAYDVATVGKEYAPGLRASLEAQIANVADELTYTTHDLDDGLYAGLLRPAQLAPLGLWNLVLDQLSLRDSEIDELARRRIIRRLIGVLVRDMYGATQQRLEAARPDSPEALQRLPGHVIGHSDTIAVQARELKTFLYANMYYHYRVIRMQKKAEQVISELFRAYIETPRQLPTQIYHRIEADKNPVERVVCDYIAGMTDRYALEEYAKLFDPHTKP